MSWAKELIDKVACEVRDSLAANPPTRRLLKLCEAAEYLSCDTKQVRNFVAANRLEAVRIDSHMRFDIRDLERFIAANKA